MIPCRRLRQYNCIDRCTGHVYMMYRMGPQPQLYRRTRRWAQDTIYMHTIYSTVSPPLVAGRRIPSIPSRWLAALLPPVPSQLPSRSRRAASPYWSASADRLPSPDCRSQGAGRRLAHFFSSCRTLRQSDGDGNKQQQSKAIKQRFALF